MSAAASRIAIIGRAGRFPGARSVTALWENLVRGVESIRQLSEEELLRAGVERALLQRPNYVRAAATLEGMEDFDAAFFGFSPREGAILDPQHRHFLECAWEALEDAGHDPAAFPGAIGVFAGSGYNAYLPQNLLTHPELVRSVGFFLLRHTGNDKDFLPTRVSYLLDLRGPSVAVQTACSTSLVAIHMACQSLLLCECDMALAGGVTIELPHGHGYLYEEGEILSPDGHCRPFDAASRGTVFGSGVGIVVLRRLEDALRDGDFIYAVILGSAVNNDGAQKVGYLAPSVDRQAAAAAEALAVAGVTADTISYMEAHGTGTAVGDPIEVAALTQAFRRTTDRRGFCALGSIKSNIGHLDTAAGVAGLIKAVEVLRHRQVPPTLHYQRPNPAIDFASSPFFVPAELQPLRGPRPLRAAVNSLGVGGTNAHVVLEEAPPPSPPAPSRTYQLLLLSAKTTAALEGRTDDLAKHLLAHPDLSLADVAYTLQVGRRAMPERRALVCRDAVEAAEALRQRDPRRLLSGTAPGERRSLVFLFPGGGAQHPGMARGLYEEEPIFRQELDLCLERLRSHVGRDPAGFLFGAVPDAAEELERPAVGLPLLFAVEYALSKLLLHWGLQPALMIGHSMGEYTAACLAGVMTVEEALELVCVRGQLFEQLPPGSMLSVPLPLAELQPLLGPEVQVAAVNAPSLCVASGPTAAIDELERQLVRRGLETRRPHIRVAAHSAMLDPILPAFARAVRRIRLRPPQMPLLSNVTGRTLTAAEATDPDYWVRHLRGTVRFADCIAAAGGTPGRVLLEVGPGNALCTFARAQLGPGATVLPSMRHPREEVHDSAFVLSVLARLWIAGVQVDWRALAGAGRRRVPLPTYPFARVRHFIEPARAAAPTGRGLEKLPDMADWFHVPAWQPAPLLGEAPRGTWLVFLDEGGLGERIAAALRGRGQTVVTAAAGPRTAWVGEGHFMLRPGQAEDYEVLMADLLRRGQAPDRILHLFCFGPPGSQGMHAAYDVAQERGFLSLLGLAQALGRADATAGVEIAVVTSGMQQVAGELLPCPERALVLGPCLVMPQELPGLRCRAIDVDELDPGSGRAVRLCEDLIRELGQNEPVVAYRGGQRFARRFVPLPLPPPVRPRLRERGTYVITGGLGGVALALAEHLARKWRARLVLLHRSPLPERAAWRDWIDRHDGQDRTSSRLRRLLALEEAGAEVLPLQVDVTSAEQVSEALRRARERFGQIHGVLHAAGVLDDGLLLLKTRQAAEAVLAPKVRGAMALEAALDGEPLDFLVLFSSVSAFSGLAGQVDYAAANAFLDAFACSRAARNGSFTLSISWNAWQEVGMAAELATRLGLVSRPSRQGEPTRHPLLSLRLQGPSEERTFSSVLSEAHWILDEHRLKGGPALLPGTAYLELARAAFQHDHGPGPLEMREVVFLSAFAVAPAAERELRVVLRPEGERWSFRVLGDTGSGWQEHARGLIGRPAAVPPVRQDLEELAARCHGQRVTPGRSDPHMDFGPRWDNRVEVCYGQGEALLRLALPPAYAAEVAGLGLHPALLDHATAGAQGLIPGADPAQDFYVPISYGRILVHRPLPARLWSHVRCRTQTPRPDAVVFDVTLLDEEGVALCEIEDFVMRRLAQPAQLAPRQGRPARTVGNRILELGLSQGILPQEGAEALERVLAGPPVPQVVVSSQDLQALLGAIRTPARNEAAQPSRDGLPAVARPCRPALPTPYVAPRTDLERTIAAVWEEALGIAGIGVHDDFFDLGGHSLLLTQVISQVRRQTGAEVSLRDLFDSPTVAGLAAQIAQARSGSAITRVARAAYRVKRSAVGQARDEE